MNEWINLILGQHHAADFEFDVEHTTVNNKNLCWEGARALTIQYGRCCVRKGWESLGVYVAGVPNSSLAQRILSGGSNG